MTVRRSRAGSVFLMYCVTGFSAGKMRPANRVENLILYQKFKDFVMWYEPIVERYPNCQKTALCATTKNECYRIIRMIIVTNRSRDKLTGLYEIDTELQVLRFHVQYACKRHYLSKKSYETAARKLVEIGKILGGLINPKRGN